jgi:hypothetical protein
MPLYRIEATVPAVQHILARSEVEALSRALARTTGWDIDLIAVVTAQNVHDVVDVDRVLEHDPFAHGEPERVVMSRV